MKKALTLVAIAFIGAASMTSCKKDYTCTCTVSTQTLKIDFNKVKKSDAKTSCESAQTTYRMADPNASCSL